MMRREFYVLQILIAGVLVLGCAPAGLAQRLDEHCTVAVLNRTVRVNPDGSWVLPNIPANFGQVKARATCTKNGVTTFGESGFFAVAANGAVNIPPIILGSATPIPSSLNIAPAAPTLAAAGQTIQLLITATYPDSSTRDVSAASTGTNYTTSNAAIATVTANGLVTAVASGTVVIQATNDGATGITTARVVLSNTDTDGDGIPDDAELQLGLDPHNPVDAQEDLDRDDLTNRQEYLLGTDIRKADTDVDGLSDGAEVNTHHTNPLLADTDGDLIPDGIEIQNATNPLDANSYDLMRATASSVLNPTSFVLTTSVLFPIATQQLSWKVNLIDGRTLLDLTADPRTSYTSSDTTVCNFGPQKGLVFAGNPGTCTITISNNTLSVTVAGTVQTFTPSALSSIDIPGFANNVDVSGNFAYVAAGSAGLQVVNVSDRQHPQIVGSRSLPGNANDVMVLGNHAYVAAGSAGLQIVDISNPLSPTVSGSVNTGGVAWDVVAKGTRAYVANGTNGLVIVNVSTPSAPALLGSLSLPGTSKGVDVDAVRQIATVALGTSGLAVVNVVNPATPVLLATLTGGDVRDVAISGNFVFLADLSRSFTSVDLSNPASPVLRASTPQNFGGRLQDVVVNGSIAAGADVFFVNGVPLIDVSTPASPQPRFIIPFGSHSGTGIAMDSSFVYLTGSTTTVENGVTGTTRLYLGQYRTIQDNAGIPPVVQITSPASGTQIIQGSTVTVTANATDDVAIASVTFFVNGQPVFATSSVPYRYTFTAPSPDSTLIIGASAIDFGNNAGQAANITLNLIPDPLTTVIGRVVDESLTPLAGANVNVAGHTGLTSADGTFSISDVPTAQGYVLVSASFTRPDGTVLAGSSASIVPVLGGATNVGEIALSFAEFENNIGTLVSREDDGVVTRAIPFSFNFYGQTYNQVFITANGTLTFNNADGDFTETASEFLSEQPQIAAFWDDLVAISEDNTSGVYVNDQIPGRLVITWWLQLEYDHVPGPSDIQIILFSDGRIQFGYHSVLSLDAIVGVSPGGLTVGSPLARVVNFSANPLFTSSAGEAIYEQFEVPTPRGSTDPPGSGQSSTRNSPFDLSGGFITITPNAGGGYVIRTIPTTGQRSGVSFRSSTLPPRQKRTPKEPVGPKVP